MRLAIVGYRGEHDYAAFTRHVDAWIGAHGTPECVVSGGAEGVDAMARRLATERSIRLVEFEPNWARYGRAAGPIRNGEIVRASTHMLAFPSRRHGRGTQDAIAQATAAGIPVTVHALD